MRGRRLRISRTVALTACRPLAARRGEFRAHCPAWDRRVRGRRLRGAQGGVPAPPPLPSVPTLSLLGTAVLLGGLLTTALQAEVAESEADDTEQAFLQSDEEVAETDGDGATDVFGGNDQDPAVMLQDIKESRRAQRSALLRSGEQET